MVWRRRWKGMCHCCAGVELNRKKQVVFMGSPTVAANALDKLLDASHSESSIFDVSAIVTQPASGRVRGKKNIPSPVAQRALDRSFPSDCIFTPEKAGEETFLANMRELKPDLCVTAAYGNILPNRFLEIPKHGTVNIHPSLLPLYRGAAPVQRALQDGVQVTGVSVAFTVRALDAGPIIASESLEIDNSVKAPELLAVLFDRGVHILLRELPSILNGSAASKALEQDESMASLAPKVSTGESWLCFDQPALTLHNKVRAFAGWPGTRTKVEIHDHTTNETQIIEVKIITTKVGSKDCHDEHINSKDPILLDGDALIFCCGGGSTLEVLELQPPGKKPMRARDFWNGLRGRKLFEA
ncbi:hypothetical protein SUGI_0980820 [Cryptomeria japonica]|nr:hypothetical protein SUGI_0980820 [Cryptomeria japonica]